MQRHATSDLLRRPEVGAFLGMDFVTAFFTIFGGVLFLSPQGTASWLNVAADLGIIAISIGAIVPAASMCIGIICGQYAPRPS